MCPPSARRTGSPCPAATATSRPPNGRPRSPCRRPCSPAATGTPRSRRCARGRAKCPPRARAEALSAIGSPRGGRHARRRHHRRRPAAVRAAARLILDDAARLTPPLALDYLALVDPADFTEIGDGFSGEAVLAVAARVGSTRLIDNTTLTFGTFGAAS
ncbi:hypothetical protein SHKM778_05070 [Streptomyces sp. KM77-8]|uniref:Pantoate--beta-alanine ligase n=1 Tax=Streptomyces haneummycinicus TaxID=3074435 RepID=A0AAT9H9U1_9ACTN